MKKLFVVFFSLLLAAVSRAQDLQNMTFFIWPRTDQLFVGSCCLDVPVETVDSTRLTVFYVMHGRTANEVYGQTLYRLQCGAHVTRFSSRAQYYANLLYTERRHGKELAGDETTKAEEAGSQLLVAPSEVWRDLTSEQLEVCYQIPFQDGRVYRYDESVPSFSWRMTELRDSVSGYDCFCAETHYAGRNWKVWFTPDLPLSAGPWKFSGLPGVILRAEDREGDYRFECCGISRGSEPIRRYLWPEYRGPAQSGFSSSGRPMKVPCIPLVREAGFAFSAVAVKAVPPKSWMIRGRFPTTRSNGSDLLSAVLKCLKSSSRKLIPKTHPENTSLKIFPP